MARLGEYASMGLAEGISEGSELIQDSAVTVIDPLLAMISAIMDSDMEFSPKITPVVDMSNAERMSGQIQDMFGNSGSYAINVARRISGNENQNGSGFGNYNSIGDTVSNTINVYAQPGQDLNELARVIEQKLVRLNKQQRLGAL